MAPRFDAIVAGVFVARRRAPTAWIWRRRLCDLLQDLARSSGRRNQPFVTAFFGSPYVPMTVPELPAMLLTYDLSDHAEESAVRAIAGEIPIGGKLPIALPGLFPFGHGLVRPRPRRRRPEANHGDSRRARLQSRYSPMLGSLFRARVHGGPVRRGSGSAIVSAPIAQLDRASGYEPGGRKFESCWAHQFPKKNPSSSNRSAAGLIAD